MARSANNGFASLDYTGREATRRTREPVKPLPNFVDLIASATTDEERERLTNQVNELAQKIGELVELKRANRGTLPRGTLPPIAHELGMSTDQVWRLVQKMDKVDRKRREQQGTSDQKGTRQGLLKTDAVIEGQRGRQKGKRECSEEVQQFIIDAWRNPNWESLNRHGLTDAIHRHINKSMIHELVQAKYPFIKIGLSTVTRIINNFELSNGAEAAYGRGQEHEAKNNLTAINADFGGPNNVWIADIRPLPQKSRYKGIDCTTGMLYIMDGSSTFVIRHKLLPRKDKDEEGNVFGVDFTCQQVRLQIVLAILQVGRRPRIIYVDNGTQFGKALQNFLDLLTADGEEPTQIIHTRPEEPAGRGIIERALALINQFIEYKPGFFPEGVDYRKSLKNTKKFKFYEFEDGEEELDHFVDFRNKHGKETKTKEKLPSPAERYAQGPDQGLTPPSLLYLGLFAGSAKRIKDRVPSREGIRYDNKHFALADESPELGAKLAGLALNKQARPIFVVTFEELVVLYVKLDDQQWVLFVEKNKRQWSAKKQRAWKDTVIKHLEQDQREAEARLQMALVDDIGQRLVIDPLPKNFTKYSREAGVTTTGTGQPGADEVQEQQSESSTSTRSNGQALAEKTRAKAQRGGVSKGHNHPSLPQMLVDDDEDDADDVPNFILQRMNNLGKKSAGDH